MVLSTSDRRPLLPYSYTYTQQEVLAPRVVSSLPSVVLTLGNTHRSLSTKCLLYVSQRFFFFYTCLFERSEFLIATSKKKKLSVCVWMFD